MEEHFIRVELIYDNNCPNVQEARRALAQAFAAVKLAPRWQEWDRADARAPAYVRRFGSPTILVNGRDIAGDAGHEGVGACRIYSDASGRAAGVPPIEPIATALLAAENASVGAPAAAAAPRSAWKNSLTALPAVGIVLLPKLTCPLCWPAYTALLGAMGIGFVNYTPYLLPLMTVFLVLTLVILGYRAPMRHGFGPFALGCVATAIILIGKFWLDSDTALYGGVALLVGASLWNAWPKRASKPVCPACVRDDRPGPAQPASKGGESPATGGSNLKSQVGLE